MHYGLHTCFAFKKKKKCQKFFKKRPYVSHHALGDFSFLFASCQKKWKKDKILRNLSLATCLKPSISIKLIVDQYKSNEKCLISLIRSKIAMNTLMSLKVMSFHRLMYKWRCQHLPLLFPTPD